MKVENIHTPDFQSKTIRRLVNIPVNFSHPLNAMTENNYEEPLLGQNTPAVVKKVLRSSYTRSFLIRVKNQMPIF